MVNNITELGKEASQLEYLISALHFANESLPENILNQGKDLNTEYKIRDLVEDEAMVNKIEVDMQQAVCVIFSALKDCQYPSGVAGSLSHILNVKETNKKPADIDAYAAIQDFPQVYESLKNKAENGEIEDLKIIPIKNIQGVLNNCFEVHGWVKIGDIRKEFSVFFQNIDPNKDPNGRVINIGYETTKINVFNMKDKDGNTVEVRSVDNDANELVYVRSLLVELKLLNLEFYTESNDKKLGISAKFLQRLSNLYLSLRIEKSEDFDNVINIIDRAISLDNNQDLIDAKEMLLNLKNNFDNKKTSDGGLAKSVCEANNLPYNIETAVDLVTLEIKSEMEDFMKFSQEIKLIMENGESPEVKRKKLNVVWQGITKVYDKYEALMKKIDKNNIHDFILYIGAIALRDNFAWKVAGELLEADGQLAVLINNNNN